MKGYLVLLLMNFSLGIAATALLFLAFFTSSWITLFQSDTNSTESPNYGLWDHGIYNLNCDVTPFSICMYVRGGLFAAMILTVPAILMLGASTIIGLSGGAISAVAYMSKSSFAVTTMAGILTLLGALLYTLQHTVCVVSCPPTYTYYSQLLDATVFGYSFYFAWTACGLLIISAVLSFVSAAWIEKSKTSYEIEKTKDGSTGVFYSIHSTTHEERGSRF